jgi:soluble lytic murein transglycosylase-like protein
MMLLILVAFAIPFDLAAIPACAESVSTTNGALDRWQGFITEAALRFNVPEAWVGAVMKAESGGVTMLNGRPITSRAGAMGLMQVRPDTYDELRRAHGLGSDPYDPRANILAGTAYLRAMYDRYGYPGLFAAYNAGPERYDEYLHDGRPLPAETRAYLASIAQIDPGSLPMASVASGTRLFFTLQTAADASSNADKASASSDLFVPLTTLPDGHR